MNEAAPDGGEWVLVVDDEDSVREVLCEVVEMGGCTPVAVSNGAEALRLLADRRPCLIILDLMMPVMSGLEFLDAVRSEPSLTSIPVVISTSAPHRAPPGVPVIPKPIEIAVLWDWMQRNCRCARQHPPA